MANIPFLNNAYFAAKVGIGIETPGGNLHVVGDTGSSGQIYLSDRDNGTGTGDALLINKSGASAFIYNRDGGQLSFGTNNVSNNLVIANTGNVGIGTTSPGVPLDVTGIIRTTTSFVGNASIVNQITAATSSGSIKFKNNSGADRAIITDAGNVGIGTTGPDKKLEVSGDIKISGGDYNGLFFENASGTTKTLLYQHASYDALVIKDIVNNADRVTFKNNGNVGIGTTSPSEKLTVEGNIELGTGGYIYGDTTTSYLRLNTAVGSLLGYSNAYIGLGPSFVYNVGGSEKFRISSASGNVGIGTTNPSKRLDIRTSGTGDGITLATSTPKTFAQIINGNSETFPYGKFTMNYGDTTPVQIVALSNELQLSGGFTTGGKISFRTATSEQMRLTETGLGIGTTAPSQKLHISGNMRLTGAFRDRLNSQGAANYVLTSTGSNGTQWVDASGSSIIGGPYLPLSAGSTKPLTGDLFLTLSSSTQRALSSSGTNSLQIGDAGVQELKFKNASGNSFLISASGNVGIGTTSPNVPLEVHGADITTRANTTAQSVLRLVRDVTDSNYTSTKDSAVDFMLSRQQTVNNNLPYTRLDIRLAGTTDSSTPSLDVMSLLHNGNVGIGTTSPGEKLEVAGNIKLNDNNQLLLGTSSGLEIFHDAADSIINNNVGHLYISQKADDKDIIFRSDDGAGGIETYFYLDGSSTGTNNPMTVFPDNSKLGFGSAAVPDLLIYHDSNNSYIVDNGTGDLVALTTRFYVKSTAGEAMFRATENGACDLFYNNIATFSTTSTGVTVTGAATATTFLGDLNGTINTATTAVTKANATNDTTVATTAFVQNLIGTIPAGLVFQGTWNAATNTPTLTSGSGTTGHFYIVSVDGSTNLDGITDWKVGDWAVFVEQGASDQWEKVDNSSVLDGSGTGQSVTKWDGSGTSNTLTDGPITFSTNDSTFAGAVSTGGYLTLNSGDNIPRLIFNGSGDDFFLSNTATYFGLYNATDSRWDIQVDGAGDTTFAGSVTVGNKLMITSSSDYIDVISDDLYIVAADKNILYSGNAETLRLDESQNATFAGAVAVNGTNVTVANASNPYIYLNDTNAGAGIFQQEGNTTRIGSDSNTQVVLVQNNATAVTIDTSKNVGIGTTSPSAKLEVAGNTTITSAAGTTLKIEAKNDTAFNDPRIEFVTWNVASGASSGKIQLTNGSYNNNDMAFFTETGNSVTEKMRIDSSGNVGIGDTSPTSISANTFSLSVNSSRADLSGALISKANGTVKHQQYWDSSGYSFQLSASSGNFKFIGGNVGIGTTSPSELLELKPGSGGDAKISMLKSDGSQKALIGYDDANGGLINLYNEAGTTNVVVRGYGDSYFNGGNFGIGDTSPSHKLTVPSGTNGRVARLGNLEITTQAGTYTGSSIEVTGSNSFIKYNSTLGHKFFTRVQGGGNTLEALTIVPDTGNVGIGTTSPGSKLQVYSAASSNVFITGYGTSAQNDWGAQNAMFVKTDNGLVISKQNAPNNTNRLYTFYNDASGNAEQYIYNTSNTATIKLDSAGDSYFNGGDVGIGTTSPDTLLQATNTADGTNYISYEIGNSAINANNKGGFAIYEFAAKQATLEYYRDGSGKFEIASQGASNHISLSTTAVGNTTPTERIRIDSAGNVGIGTSSPNQKLQVGGNLHVYDEEGDTDASIFLSTGTSNVTTVKIASNGDSYINGGNVGIGTTSPSARLEVLTTTTNKFVRFRADNNEQRFEFYVGASGNPSRMSMHNDAATETIRFASAGNSYLNGGNVGIGTTAPGATLPTDSETATKVLQLAGVSGSAGDTAVLLRSSDNSSGLDLWHNASTGDSYIDNRYNSNQGDTIFRVKTAGTPLEALRITGNGNVGIGTTSPNYKLASYSSGDEFAIVAGAGNAVGEFTGIGLSGYITTNAAVKAGLVFERETSWGIGKMHFLNNNTLGDSDATLSDSKMTIDSTGNVGIGTTSPGYRLEVDGGIGDGVKIKAGNAASKDSLLVSTNSNVSKFLVQGDGKVIINSSAGISGRNENFQVFGEQIITNTGTDGPVLYLGYNSSGSNTIQLGRGRTADGLSYMDFNGEVMSAGQFGFRIIRYSGQNASTELKQVGTGAFKVTCSNSANIILNPNSGSVGISQTNPSYKLDVTGNGRFTSTVTATNFILSSDERLKENVEKVCDNKVEADWKTFELKTEKGQKRYGVIAQELEKTNPEFVREDSQGFKSVAYIDLLIAKIAELEARLEKLEK